MKKFAKLLCLMFFVIIIAVPITSCANKKDITNSKYWIVHFEDNLATPSMLDVRSIEISGYTFVYQYDGSEEEHMPEATIYVDGKKCPFIIKKESKRKYDPIRDEWDLAAFVRKKGVYKVKYLVYENEKSESNISAFIVNIIIE